MGNDIALVTKYLPLLDEVYKVNAKSSILEAPSALVQATADAKTIKINKLSMDGLGDYSRQNGYPVGSITSDWETHEFTNDRGRRFNLDKMDNLENLSMAFLHMAGEFMRTKVIPEKDAYTFAKIAGTKDIAGTTGNLSSSTTKAAIEAAIATLGENEVDEENLVLFTTPTVKGYLEAQMTRSFPVGETAYGQKIEYFNDIPLITVPQTRFYTGIDLFDGVTSGEIAGGYRKHVAQSGVSGDADAKNINFILMDKAAALSIAKNNVAQIFAPEVNQNYDGWTFNYRFYYDVFVLSNKKQGIYAHVANS